MSGLALKGLSSAYQYLRIFNANGDKVLDEKDSPVLKDVDTPEEAEKAVTENILTLSEMPQIFQICTTIPELPEGYIQVEVEREVDGDTCIIKGDFNDDGKKDSIRVANYNSTEMGKGPTLEARLRNAEPGAVTAWERLKEKFGEAKGKAYLDPFSKRDSYGRAVSRILTKIKSVLQDLSAVLIWEGMGHGFFVQLEDKEQYFCYQMLQIQAKKAKRGVWKILGDQPIHITSFHPDARKKVDEGASTKDKIIYVEEPLDEEYARIANLHYETVDLANFRVLNKVSGEIIPLPPFLLPPLRTVKLVTGGIETNSDPNRDQLVLSFGRTKPLWENEDEGGACLVIQTKDGQKVITYSAKYKYKGCP